MFWNQFPAQEKECSSLPSKRNAPELVPSHRPHHTHLDSLVAEAQVPNHGLWLAPEAG